MKSLSNETIKWTEHRDGMSSIVYFGAETFASAGGRSRLVLYVTPECEKSSRCLRFTCYEMRDPDIGGRVLRHVSCGFETVASAKNAAEGYVSWFKRGVRMQ